MKLSVSCARERGRVTVRCPPPHASTHAFCLMNHRYKMLRSAFRAIDEDKSGYLGVEEIINAVQHFALPIPLSHVHEIFAGMDTDGDGQVSYAEFAAVIKTYDDAWIVAEEQKRKEKLA